MVRSIPPSVRAGRPRSSSGTAVHASSAGVTGLAVTPTGEIVGSGHIDYIGGDGHGSAGVFRLTSSGHLDPSYGTARRRRGRVREPGRLARVVVPVRDDARCRRPGDGHRRRFARRRERDPHDPPDGAGVPDPSFGTAGDGRVVIPGASGGEDTTCGAAAGRGATSRSAPGPASRSSSRTARPTRASLPAASRTSPRLRTSPSTRSCCPSADRGARRRRRSTSSTSAASCSQRRPAPHPDHDHGRPATTTLSAGHVDDDAPAGHAARHRRGQRRGAGGCRVGADRPRRPRRARHDHASSDLTDGARDTLVAGQRRGESWPSLWT